MAKKSNTPLVSIVLPVYNAGDYLAETLDSILRQTFHDYELLAVNDGSSDNSQVILDAYAKRDSRIVVIQQENKGLVTTLNETIAMARGTYIARADADDPSFSTRLEQQVATLRKDSGMVLVSGGFEIIDENGYFIETIHALTRDEDIRRTMMLRNPFGHAGVMFRKDAFNKVGGYSNNYGPTEDFELWIRLSSVGRLGNIPMPVYRYRVVGNGISQSSSKVQTEFTDQHIDGLWASRTPRILTRREIKTQANRYLHLSTRPSYAIGLKEQFLLDNAQIAMKLVRHGHFLSGCRQLLYVASIGRSGLRAVKKRLRMVDAGSVKRAINQ